MNADSFEMFINLYNCTDLHIQTSKREQCRKAPTNPNI